MEISAAKNRAGVTPEAFASVYPRLYHMAHPDGWPQIERFGLLRSSSILERWEIEASLRMRLETQEGRRDEGAEGRRAKGEGRRAEGRRGVPDRG
jgi:hypothetical protein